MRPATAYSKCYILYLFVAVILLSLTSFHMCVVVTAEEPLEENVVAELKQKAGEVEALAGDVKKANEEMVTSARKVVNLLTETTVKINEAKEDNKEMAEKEKEDEWAATLEATNSAKENADKAVKVAEKIQTAANEARGAMQKMAAGAKVILSDTKNINNLIDEFKNETDKTVSLWGEVSSDDVQSLLDITNTIVEETNKAKEEAETVRGKTKEVLVLKKKNPVKAEDALNSKQRTSTATNEVVRGEPPATSASPELSVSSESLTPTEPKGPKGSPGVQGPPGELGQTGVSEKTRSLTPEIPSRLEASPTARRVPAAAKILQGQNTKNILRTKYYIKQATAKIMRLMQTEMAAGDSDTEDSEQKNKKENVVVELLENAAVEAVKLKEAVQLVKKKIDNARQLSERVAQLVDKVIQMRESKELSVLPSSFGSFVFVVNNICLTTFVTLTYVFGNTL